MQYNVLVVIVLCMLVFILTIQFQLNELNAKIQDTNKKIDELLKERPKEKSNPTIQNMQF
jgi:cell division protein FtsL